LYGCETWFLTLREEGRQCRMLPGWYARARQAPLAGLLCSGLLHFTSPSSCPYSDVPFPLSLTVLLFPVLFYFSSSLLWLLYYLVLSFLLSYLSRFIFSRVSHSKTADYSSPHPQMPFFLIIRNNNFFWILKWGETRGKHN
jgi:hypothetical protein